MSKEYEKKMNTFEAKYILNDWLVHQSLHPELHLVTDAIETMLHDYTQLYNKMNNLKMEVEDEFNKTREVHADRNYYFEGIGDARKIILDLLDIYNKSDNSNKILPKYEVDCPACGFIWFANPNDFNAHCPQCGL